MPHGSEDGCRSKVYEIKLDDCSKLYLNYHIVAIRVEARILRLLITLDEIGSRDFMSHCVRDSSTEMGLSDMFLPGTVHRSSMKVYGIACTLEKTRTDHVFPMQTTRQAARRSTAVW